MLSSRWATGLVPAIGSIAGDRESCHARATWHRRGPVPPSDLDRGRPVEILDRCPRQEGHVLLLAQVDEAVRAAVAEVVAVLHRHDRRERLRPPELLLIDVADADVADLALLLQLDECAD